MIKRLVPLLVAGYALWQLQSHRQQRQALAQRSKPRHKVADVNTWEGEGGALPVTGSQVGPDPVQR